MFALNSLNSETKIFVITVKGFKPVTSCVRNQDAATTAARQHVRDRIFKLSLVHASLNSVKVLLHFGKTPIETLQRTHILRLIAV